MDNIFKNRIDHWMTVKGLKNKHLATLCSVTDNTFSRWRKNKNQPDLKSAAIIAKHLLISVDELYEWEGED